MGLYGLTGSDALGGGGRLEGHSGVHGAGGGGASGCCPRVAGKLMTSSRRHGLEGLTPWTGLRLRPAGIANSHLACSVHASPLGWGDGRGEVVAIVGVHLANLLGRLQGREKGI